MRENLHFFLLESFLRKGYEEKGEKINQNFPNRREEKVFFFNENTILFLKYIIHF